MATRNIRERVRNSDGTYDIVYKKTSGSLVEMADGTTAEQHKADKQAHIPTLTHTKTGTIHTLAGTVPATGLYTIRFKSTAIFTTGDTFTIGGVSGYTGQNTALEPIESDMFKIGATVSCEVDVTGKKVNFKSGGGKATNLLNFPITIDTVLPSVGAGVAGQLHVMKDIIDVDYVEIDDAIRISHKDKSIILKVDDTNNGQDTIIETKKVSGKNIVTTSNRLPTNENETLSWDVSKADSKNLSTIKRKKPIAISKINNVIDVETTYQHNGTGWDMLSQKGHYMLQTFTTAPFVRLMYNNDGTNFAEHTALEGISVFTTLSHIMCIEVSNDNKWFVIGSSASSALALIYYRQGDSFTKIIIPSQINTTVTSVAFSKDNTKVAFGMYDGKVHVFSINGSVLTFVKTFETLSGKAVANIKFTVSKLVIIAYRYVFTRDLVNFNPITQALLVTEVTSNRCLEVFEDNGKEYALVLNIGNTMELCELGASVTTITTVSGMSFGSGFGFQQSYNTMYYIGSFSPNTVLWKRNGIAFTKVSEKPFISQFRFDINNNIYFSNKNKYIIENDILVSKGNYNTPYGTADKLLTIAPSY